MKNEKTHATFEYKMPEAMVKMYLKVRKEKGLRVEPQEYLCQIVNENFGLKGYCTKVLSY